MFDSFERITPLDRIGILVPQGSADAVPKIQGMIRASGTPPIFRISHQPNFLAYWRLVGQFLFADECRRKAYGADWKAPTLTWVVNDYDAWRDERTRRAEFPVLNARSGQPHYLRMAPVKGTPSGRILSRVGVIPEGYDVHLTQSILGYLAGLRGSLPPSRRRPFSEVTQELVGDIAKLLVESRDWAEFGVAYLLWTLKCHGVSDVKVVSGTTQIMAAQDVVWETAEEVASGLGVPIESLLWALCGDCGQRYPVETCRANSVCPVCQSDWFAGGRAVLPRVVLDDLLDDAFYPGSVSFSHIGGFEHVLQSHAARTELSRAATTLEVMSDQGRRADHMFKYVVRSAVVSSVTGGVPRHLRELYGRSLAGHYSSLYYLIGDVFESRKYWL